MFQLAVFVRNNGKISLTLLALFSWVFFSIGHWRLFNQSKLHGGFKHLWFHVLNVQALVGMIPMTLFLDVLFFLMVRFMFTAKDRC
jgi:hypothetical protein